MSDATGDEFADALTCTGEPTVALFAGDVIATHGAVQAAGGGGGGGCDVTVTVVVALELAPLLSVTVPRTVNVPVALYVCCAVVPPTTVPSPKSMVEDVMV